MSYLDILGLLQAFEHTMEFGAMPKGYDRTQLRAAIKRLEQAEIVEGSGLMMWDGSPYVRFSPTGHIQFMGLRPAVLIVLEADDEQ